MTIPIRHFRWKRPRRGSAIVMAIIVSVVITSIVMMIAWTSATMIQSTGNYTKQVRAYYVAEGAAQRAYWRFKKDNTWRALAGSPMTGTDTVDGFTYSYSLTCTGAASSPVLVTSTATYGSVQAYVQMTLTTNVKVAALAAGTTLNITSATTTITGDINAVGAISLTGNGSITGNLLSGSTINHGLFTVSGSTTPSDSGLTAPPSPATIYNTEKAAAWTYGGSANNPVLNFAINPIIYINGNVTLGSNIPTGSGTLVVNGTVSFGSNPYPSDGSTANMNIVANNDIKPQGTVRINGGIYTSGTFNKTGTTYLTGVIDANAVQINGSTYITVATPPSFDPRSGGSGSGALTVSNYGGPNP